MVSALSPSSHLRNNTARDAWSGQLVSDHPPRSFVYPISLLPLLGRRDRDSISAQAREIDSLGNIQLNSYLNSAYPGQLFMSNQLPRMLAIMDYISPQRTVSNCLLWS